MINVFREVEWTEQKGPGSMNFAMKLNSEYCKILDIGERTPFYLSGGREGDIVKSLNSVPVNGHTWGGIRKMWYTASIGEMFDVTFLRDGKEIQSKVKIPEGIISKFVKKMMEGEKYIREYIRIYFVNIPHRST